MKNFLIRPYRWAILLSIVLTCSFALVLLDTFVFPKAVAEVTPQNNTSGQTQSAEQGDAITTNNSYEDDHIKIKIETAQEYDTTFYVADIQLSDASYLKTALAEDTYGRNIKETTSEIAENHKAIFAINGDYYGFRDSGYVLRNGVLYRSSVRKSGDDEALVIDKEGNLSIVNENQVSAQSLSDEGVWQVLSFGPALVENSEIVVNSGSEVSQSQSSNPRTAIGQVSSLHYIVIVADGRTNESKGLSLLELAQEFTKRGCTVAYNLDGGGSSTMYLNGKVINNPTDGRNSGEREVSDIVYVGY